jgi:two-component system chemotaxis sensor kinase CheA
MAIVGEIVITESMVTSSPEIQNLKLDSFLKSTRQLRKLTDDLQDIAMSLRMVPLSGTFQKMNRIVRDMKKKLGKDVRLTIEGENTEVDKTIVDSISDPIMHIVRNSMDHGIEPTVEERIAAGKPAEAEIILSATHTGSEVIISVSDDGRGMDPDKILAKAEKNGILTKPASEYSQKEILSLLMVPGFSTNESVTEFSGRGVGMDVVKKNVESVGGIISITSELGQGSCTTLKIPLTMAIVDGMEISVGNSMFTIPIANIRQSFKAAKEDVILDANGNEIIKCMDEFYPIVRVHSLYNIETDVTEIEDGILIWVEASDKSYCLFVDELLGEQQVVVKPLPAFLSYFNIKDSGISGCTILGDGNISIILDILNLYTASKNHY